MALGIGARLGPYEIQALLGAGGMGEVYRARDTRLERTVAVKVLSSALGGSPELKARFEREARTISQLNHPHICTLHDVGSHEGSDFLVMEYLEGETLAERLKKGPLPLDQALKIAIQVADALGKAHSAGIVHRDLKPGNIMLTKSGAKLLDFGLAKPAGMAAAAASGPAPLLSAAVTMSSPSPQLSPLTTAGSIVGTIQYMSPEQIEGREADARSDMFAFGAVLYEMVTGRRAFEGKSQISVASAILEKDPEPVTAIQRTAPAALDHVIRTCLAKDREERYQSAFDVKLELRWISEAPQAVATTAAPRKQWLAWALATALALTALALAVTYYATRPGPGPPLMASVVPPPGVFPDSWGRNGPPQISPDGGRLAFVGCKTESAALSNVGSNLCLIWLRSLRSTDAHEVAGTSGGYYPFWSPDGREIGFFADGKLKRVAADGGPVQIICDAEDARGGSWAKSGTIIFAATRGSPIFRVSADGGTPVAITALRAGLGLVQFGSHRWPYFLPDGQHFLYDSTPTGGCVDIAEMRFASLDGKQDLPLMRMCSSAAFAAGRLIYWRDGNLVAQPFDPRRGLLSGTALPIVDQVAFDSLFNFGEFSSSADGKLVYVGGQGTTGAQLVWYDRTGKMLGTLGQNDQYSTVAISPDGSRVAIDAGRMVAFNIWVLDRRGTRTRLTSGSGGREFPAWSPDGQQIYFTSNANGPWGIFVKAADGSGEEQPVVRFEKGQFDAAFLAASPDGKYLAYVTSDPATKLDIYIVALAGDRKPQPFLRSPASETAPAFSPDGRWLAYESDRSGRNEIYVTPFPAGGAQYQVSTNGGERPVWRRDGKEIFYRANLGIMAVEVNTKGRTIELSAPKSLFELPVRNLTGRYYDVSPDGRFLANTSLRTNQAQNFELLVNWPGKLNQ